MTNEAWHSMRASDADRERAADVIKAALAEGRISWDEHHSRLDHAMEAKTYGELEHAVRHLPTGITPPSSTPPAVVPPHGAHPAYVPARQRTNSLAVASLICGGLGFATGFTSIAAIITGHMALSRIKQTGEEGHGMAVAGLALGYTVVIGGVLLLLLGIGVLLAGA